MNQMVHWFNLQGRDCMYESERLIRGSGANSNRDWRDASATLPAGNYKVVTMNQMVRMVHLNHLVHMNDMVKTQVYALAQYDGTGRYNTGQVGLAQLKTFKDRSLSQPAC